MLVDFLNSFNVGIRKEIMAHNMNEKFPTVS